MQLQSLQNSFGVTPSPAASLVVTLPNPTVVGNALSLYLRSSPLTGTPLLTDNFGNKFKRMGITNLSPTQSASLWTAEIIRGGANHAVTATSQGGPQTMEMGVVESSIIGPERGKGIEHSSTDILFEILIQQSAQTTLLQRIATALRA